MTWLAPEVSLPDVNLLDDDAPLLEGFLTWHRALLLHKCEGLTGEQLAVCSVPPSNLSLLGLLRHMAKVERNWFQALIPGRTLEPMYDAALGVDADFEGLHPDRAEDDYARLLEQIRISDEVLASTPYSQTLTARMGEMTVRAVVIHMIEEYAQHNGHADLLREALDGTTDK